MSSWLLDGWWWCLLDDFEDEDAASFSVLIASDCLEGLRGGWADGSFGFLKLRVKIK
jgi:hypothetical protein